MNQCVVMEQAFVGAVRGIRDRIDEAVAGNEVWTYQLGEAPRYVGKHSVLDEDFPDNDSITVAFYKSPWDVYDYRFRVTFLDREGILDVMIIDIGIEENRFNVMADHSQGVDDIATIQMVESDASFIFQPVEDLCTVLSAMSFITIGEKLQSEQATLAVLQAEEKKARLSRFKVYDGSKS
ncbi:hypothetical protein D9M68_20410 [compost metagenome]